MCKKKERHGKSFFYQGRLKSFDYWRRVLIIASANSDSISYNQRRDPGISFQSVSFFLRLKEMAFLFSSFDVMKNLVPFTFCICVNSNNLISLPTTISLLNLSTVFIFYDKRVDECKKIRFTKDLLIPVFVIAVAIVETTVAAGRTIVFRLCFHYFNITAINRWIV